MPNEMNNHPYAVRKNFRLRSDSSERRKIFQLYTSTPTAAVNNSTEVRFREESQRLDGPERATAPMQSVPIEDCTRLWSLPEQVRN
jgi:hypothetical protein